MSRDRRGAGPRRRQAKIAGWQRASQKLSTQTHSSHLTVAASFATVLATVAAFVTLWVLVREDRPDVEIIAFVIDAATEIEGTAYEAGNGAIGSEIFSAETAVDVTIKNSGNEPELITELRLILHDVTYTCATGGGGVSIEAEYDFKLPYYEPETAMPQTHTKSIRFELEPNRVDRLRVTLGPENTELGVDSAEVYAFDLFAVTASKPEDPLLLGKGRMAAPNYDVETFIANVDDTVKWRPDCVYGLVNDLRKMDSLEGSTSPEYRALIERMRVFENQIPDGSQLDNVDWLSVVKTRLDCSGISDEVELNNEVPVVRADVNHDQAMDAIVTYRCLTGVGTGRSQVQVFDGLSDPNNLHSMGTILADPGLSDPYNGVYVEAVRFDGVNVVLSGYMYHPNDSNCCASLQATQTARWNGSEFDIVDIDITARPPR